MARIIRIDAARKPAKAKVCGHAGCNHRRVTAWRNARMVTCDLCGATLDPFDVLVDMLQTLPPEGGDDEEERFLREAGK